MSDFRLTRLRAFAPSPARLGLDALLRFYPHFDVLSIDWQLRDESRSDDGPWVLVSLGQASAGDLLAWARWDFAIWRATGAVHIVGRDGAVSDDPIFPLPPTSSL